MTALILALALLFSPIAQTTTEPPWEAASSLPVSGQATFYAPGLMEQVYEYRLRLGQAPVCDPPQCAGHVALLRPGDLGRQVWLQAPGRPVEGPFLVVDYAARQDFERLRERGLVVEVDYETARRWGMWRPLSDVQVMGESPFTHRLSLPLVSAGRPAAEEPSAAPRAARYTQRLWLPLSLHNRP